MGSDGEMTGPNTYRNPVLYEDWPDPDAIRVGDDYYLIASSFNRSPGLPVLHSTDLVTWTVIAHALPRVAPDSYGRLPRHGQGVWAPAIRHHDGGFHIVYPDPDRGIFVTSAADPRGPWSSPRLLLGGLGLIDPCPLWASDGRTWLVHGWARSRAGKKNRLTMIEVDAGLAKPLGPGVVVVDGDDLGWETLEGPKLYEREGWYWIFAPAGGVATGFQAVLRSRDPLGPYESRIVLAQGDSPVNGPHQGAWIDTPEGRDWFLHFSDQDAFGRVLHLQPMAWRDGWPVMGDPVPGKTWGQPVLEHPTPHATPAGPRSLFTGDTFADGLDLRWRWQADAGDWADARDGVLRLTGPAFDAGNLRTVPSVLGQPLPGLGLEIQTTVRLDGPKGSRAGIVLLGLNHAWVGLLRTASGCDVVVATHHQDEPDDQRTIVGSVTYGQAVGVRMHVDEAGSVQFCIAEGDTWRPVGDAFVATKGQWIGAEVALFATAPIGADSAMGRFGPVVSTLDTR